MGTETESASLVLPRQQAALLVGVTLAVFGGTLSAGFVYDARLQILTDPFLHDQRNWWPVLTFGTLSMDVLDFNRPVNLASLMLDAAVWGKNPFGYHLTSVILHALNAVLVWLLLRRLGTCPRPARFPAAYALLGALVFALHPLVTEAVCEPTFREDLLVACFTLAALVLVANRPPATIGPGFSCALAVAACSLLAIGSKESGIAAPMLLVVFWLLFEGGSRSRFWAVTILASITVVAAFLVARFQLEVIPSAIFESRPQYPGGTLAAAMAIQPRILALYAQLAVFPVNQCADYGMYSVRHLPLGVAIFLLVLLVSLAAVATRHDRRMGLAMATIVLPLLPVMNLIPIYRAAADRYLYLSLAGVGLATGFLLDAPWLVRRDRLRERLLIAAAILVAALGKACIARQAVWASPVALWEDTYRKNPAAFTAASGLGDALRTVGRLAEAEQATRIALRLSDARRGDTWATLALILDAQGRTAEAESALAKALEMDPRLGDPPSRVRALAMEQDFAVALGRLLERRARP